MLTESRVDRSYEWNVGRLDYQGCDEETKNRDTF